MGKKRSNAAQRTWNLLRLALLRARKGGVLKCRLMAELRVVPKFLKGLRHSGSRDVIHYGERELSFDETPVIRLRMSRPASLRFMMPCIKPQVDFDYDFDDDDDYGLFGNDEARKGFLESAAYEEEQEEEQGCDSTVYCGDDEGIDVKAEEFIAKFYEQIKLQRQISHLQYTAMINRGAS
ncbi:hypothetical protein Ancab_020317 [Ancistrocladus abbreviatus]